jgi:catechol-2,3-dioxygenase
MQQSTLMISPNGIAHIQLTVRDLAASRAFYRKLLHETLGMATRASDLVLWPPSGHANRSGKKEALNGSN